MVTKKRSIGKNKACCVHDLMLDFCKEKAEEDNFLLWLNRYQDAKPPHFYSEKPVHRRLSFCSNRDDLARVLDLEFVDVKSFPTELNHLRHLAIQTCEDSIWRP
ncbi:hypothetical protein RND71_008709 [Anisodus tanguticus]|uniref:Uncharacterized protein n=1 Tax=Anisodus tanguticus TaxID=243964 RepID=A0AAE1SP85_9SOLA|nr:hypothetical protein RND71_008709 [Anisodus tanguticus]